MLGTTTSCIPGDGARVARAAGEGFSESLRVFTQTNPPIPRTMIPVTRCEVPCLGRCCSGGAGIETGGVLRSCRLLLRAPNKTQTQANTTADRSMPAYWLPPTLAATNTMKNAASVANKRPPRLPAMMTGIA